MSDEWNDCDLHGSFKGKVCVPCLEESRTQLQFERDRLCERVKHLEGDRIKRQSVSDKFQSQLTTATEDFDTTWAALMKLEGKFTLAKEAMMEADKKTRALLKRTIGVISYKLLIKEIINSIEQALAELDK